LLQYGRCQALSRRDECYRFDGVGLRSRLTPSAASRRAVESAAQCLCVSV